MGGAKLTGANKYAADKSGADLTRADLSWADLTKADLSGANPYQAKWHPELPPSWPKGFDAPENAWDPEVDG